MKKSMAYLLTALILAGSVIDLHDLSKVPYMLRHFQQHKSNTESFSFSDFFDLHYGASAEQHDKQEHEQHKGLPFKTHDCTTSHISMILTDFEPNIESSFGLTISYNNFYESAYSSDFCQSIWQPPKLVV
ncbi:MAG: hypothetical protein KF856_00225 [Cyclobacteriaceae bacterium]|nr:hypothetical protein [Cyclobacteriaceae bacterium]